MTELSWLVDLLVNFKLSKSVKDHVLSRIKEIDARGSQFSPQNMSRPESTLPAHLQSQSPSTIANFLKNPQAGGTISGTTIVVSPAATEPIVDITAVVASPAAAQAMQSRQEALNAALSGKREPGRTSPRKF